MKTEIVKKPRQLQLFDNDGSDSTEPRKRNAKGAACLRQTEWLYLAQLVNAFELSPDALTAEIIVTLLGFLRSQSLRLPRVEHDPAAVAELITVTKRYWDYHSQQKELFTKKRKLSGSVAGWQRLQKTADR